MECKSIYPNLDAELARLRVPKKELAQVIGKKPQALYNKLNGKTELTLSEARIIRAFVEKRAGQPISFLRLFSISE